MSKKQNIIQAASELLVRKGLHATPMSAIAEAANVGMGTIYNYFSTKEMLINAIYIDIKHQEKVLLAGQDTEQPVRVQLEHSYLLVTEFYLKNPIFFQFIDQLQHSPIITEESRQEGYKAIEPIIEILERGQKERIIKNISIEELLQFLGGTLLSYTRWLIKKNQKQVEASSIQNQLYLVWDAIKT